MPSLCWHLLVTLRQAVAQHGEPVSAQAQTTFVRGRRFPLLERVLATSSAGPVFLDLLDIEDAVVGVEEGTAGHGLTQEARVRADGNHLLGTAIEVLEASLRPREERLPGVGVGCSRGRDLVWVDGIDLGEVDLGKLLLHDGDGGASVARVVGKLCQRRFSNHS